MLFTAHRGRRHMSAIHAQPNRCLTTAFGLTVKIGLAYRH
jgi:hypothetical protein